MKARAIISLSPVVFAVAHLAAAEPAAAVLKLPMDGYAGHFREHCMDLQGGNMLRVAVRSPHPVRLNVHHHTAGKTLFLLDEIIAGPERSAVEITDDGEYCLEVRNPETRPSAFDLELEYQVVVD